MGDSRSGQWFRCHFPLALPAHCPAPNFVLNFAGHGRPAFTTRVRIDGGGSPGYRPGGHARASGRGLGGCPFLIPCRRRTSLFPSRDPPPSPFPLTPPPPHTPNP